MCIRMRDTTASTTAATAELRARGAPLSHGRPWNWRGLSLEHRPVPVCTVRTANARDHAHDHAYDNAHDGPCSRPTPRRSSAMPPVQRASGRGAGSGSAMCVAGQRLLTGPLLYSPRFIRNNVDHSNASDARRATVCELSRPEGESSADVAARAEEYHGKTGVCASCRGSSVLPPRPHSARRTLSVSLCLLTTYATPSHGIVGPNKLCIITGYSMAAVQVSLTRNWHPLPCIKQRKRGNKRS
jgi:hypothetical protein